MLDVGEQDDQHIVKRAILIESGWIFFTLEAVRKYKKLHPDGKRP